MKDQIKEILDNAELDSENKTEQIAKLIGEQTVIKSKYNDKIAELRAKETELNSLQSEYDTLKTSTMSDSEKAKKQEDLIKAKEVELSRKINTVTAKELLANAGFAEKDYKDIINLEDYVSEDAEMSNKRVNSIVELLTKTKETTTTKVKEDLLKNTPKPNINNEPQTKEITKEDFKKMSGEERATLFRENKEMFEKLRNEI